MGQKCGLSLFISLLVIQWNFGPPVAGPTHMSSFKNGIDVPLHSQISFRLLSRPFFREGICFLAAFAELSHRLVSLALAFPVLSRQLTFAATFTTLVRLAFWLLHMSQECWQKRWAGNNHRRWHKPWCLGHFPRNPMEVASNVIAYIYIYRCN